MPTEDFSTGLDVALDIYDPVDNSISRIGGITRFRATPMTGDLESHTIDGEDRFGTTYRGWEMEIGYDRFDGLVDAYFAERERRYRAGLALQTVTVTQTIAERDGSVSQYRFERVTLKQTDTGDWNREDKVSGSLTGRAGRRVKVA